MGSMVYSIFPNCDLVLMSADDIKGVLGDALRTAR